MSKSTKQRDKEGYLEGFNTGLLKGYKYGIQDGLRIVQDMLEDNGIHLADSEFYTQMQTMKDEGTIKEPHEYTK